MTNPYRIDGPALISFSGGRTSGFMLWHILDAYDGKLPEDVHVCFANTGKEREETLRFVHECESRWDIRIHWLEWRSRLKRTPVAERFEEVGYNSAARRGEPFKALVRSKKSTPNAIARWCTEHLKVQVCADFMEARGYSNWNNVIGLRSDELRRVVKKHAQNEAGLSPWVSLMPMVKARVTKPDILSFWFGGAYDGGRPNWERLLAIPPTELPLGFDLGLQDGEGNCTKCFMKGKRLLLWDIRRDPEDTADWVEMEWLGNGTFTTEFSFLDLIEEARRSPLLPLGPEAAEFDAECGVSGTDTRIRCGRRAA